MQGEKENLQFIRGSLWGAVLGDVIGAYLQFNHSIDKQMIDNAFLIKGGGMHKLQPGQPTDDSQLAYSVGKGLIKGKQKLNLNLIATQMGNWFQSKPIDVGNTIRKSVPKAVNMKVHQAHLCRKGAKQNSQKSQSNGTLMAITPLSIWCFRLDSKNLIKTVKQYSILIHSNQLVFFANTFYTLGLCYLLRNQKNQKRNFQAFEFAKNQIKITLQQSKNGDQFKNWILTIQKCLDNPQIIQTQCSPTKKPGWVRVALTLAYRQLLKGKSFKQSIKNILKEKGDTDTNACIAGGILGAYYGIKNIEQQLSKQIQKIKNWRPKNVKRPEWLVPGIVLQNLAYKLLEYGPIDLQIIGGQQQYNKK